MACLLAVSLAACADSASPPLKESDSDPITEEDGDADDSPEDDDIDRAIDRDSGPRDGSAPRVDGAEPGPILNDDGVPAAPPYAIHVPAFAQPKGNADKGYDYLVNGEYVRIGPALEAFIANGPPLEPRDTVPGRSEQNKGLGYIFNAAHGDDGQLVAAPNCLACHASHLQGKLILGLGRANHMVKTDTTGASLNIPGIVVSDLSGADNGLDFFLRLFRGPLVGHHMDVFAELASHHDPKTLVWSDEASFDSQSGFKGWVDFPPWWATKKKNALYYNGTGRGVKGHHLQLMSFFSVKDVAEATKIEAGFTDVNAWIDQLQAPKFPGKIDAQLAEYGEKVFFKTCAQCHGTYGATDAEDTYPNLLIPTKDVGTDPNLATNHWMYKAIPWYNESWYARNKDSWFEKVDGYMAPPLDGVWATAPYFHNGSVPTLDGVIDPKKRPAKWTSNNSDDDYDLERVGWMDKPGDFQLLTLDSSFGTYDTSRDGNSNQGHTYGAALNAEEQKALLEYLKTL